MSVLLPAGMDEESVARWIACIIEGKSTKLTGTDRELADAVIALVAAKAREAVLLARVCDGPRVWSYTTDDIVACIAGSTKRGGGA